MTRKWFVGYLDGLRMQVLRLDYTPTFDRKPNGWLAALGPYQTRAKAQAAILAHNCMSNATYAEVR